MAVTPGVACDCGFAFPDYSKRPAPDRKRGPIMRHVGERFNLRTWARARDGQVLRACDSRAAAGERGCC